MCFASGGSKTSTPAPAPAAPEPAPVASDVGAARKAEETTTFGGRTPTLRRDRTTSPSLSGGSGLAM